MAEVSVRAMTQEEFEAWQHQIARAFAEEQIATGNWRAEQAFERALAGNAALLPEGLATPGMLLLRGVLPDGRHLEGFG